MSAKPHPSRPVISRRPVFRGRPAGAFTLLEVMIATGILFVAIFAILALIFANLRNARLLQQARVDAGPLAADLYSTTNQWQEGSDSGDFGDLYPDYKWQSETTEMLTNKFFKVDFVIVHPDGVIETNLSAFFWRPNPPPAGARPSLLNRQ
jgi:Tfp pilus assembly protein PilV